MINTNVKNRHTALLLINRFLENKFIKKKLKELLIIYFFINITGKSRIVLYFYFLLFLFLFHIIRNKLKSPAPIRTHRIHRLAFPEVPAAESSLNANIFFFIDSMDGSVSAKTAAAILFRSPGPILPPVLTFTYSCKSVQFLRLDS